MTDFDTNVFRVVVFADVRCGFRFVLPRIPDDDVRHGARARHLQAIVDEDRIAVLAAVDVDPVCFAGELDGRIGFRFGLTTVDLIQIRDVVQTRSTKTWGNIAGFLRMGNALLTYTFVVLMSSTVK